MLRCNLAALAVAFALATVAASNVEAAAQRTFVASYGLDTNPCTLSLPCRGFQAAINAVAAAGEVVAIDTAGYGSMEIHKSVSVIVPPGVHAGLSPATGVPLPGYPGQFGVVLIDIQNTDVVVLRGLNINQQGTVTGGIEWISAQGGTVHVENVVVNGFSKEGIYVQAPNAALFVKDSILRNNGTAIYGGIAGGGRGFIQQGGIFTDHVRIENSTTGVRLLSDVGIILSNSEIVSNDVAFDIQANTGYSSSVRLDRCSVVRNGTIFTLFGQGGGLAGQPLARWEAAASTLSFNGPGSRSGSTDVNSFGNNSLESTGFFDTIHPPQ